MLKEIVKKYAATSIGVLSMFSAGCEIGKEITPQPYKSRTVLNKDFNCKNGKIDMVIALSDKETRPVDLKVKNITQGETSLVLSKEAEQRGVIMWTSTEGRFPNNDKLRLKEGDQVVFTVYDPRQSKSKPIIQTDTFVSCN